MAGTPETNKVAEPGEAGAGTEVQPTVELETEKQPAPGTEKLQELGFRAGAAPEESGLSTALQILEQRAGATAPTAAPGEGFSGTEAMEGAATAGHPKILLAVIPGVQTDLRASSTCLLMANFQRAYKKESKNVRIAVIASGEPAVVENIIIADEDQVEALSRVMKRELVDADLLGLQVGDKRESDVWTRNIEGEDVSLPIIVSAEQDDNAVENEEEPEIPDGEAE